ncbi:hypothetical protein [Lentzea flava]|uniref:hypothetical protein n=1 Tax=Lentzea flava TaxID=103732 RepID=UPI0016706AF7|nr:hypothetical protein [Lentzea flava]MCP2200770.1 hypothetical protein [Lentzea flava]
MTDDPTSYNHSARDGFFDGSADDIEDFHSDDFPRSRRHSGHYDLSGAPAWVVAFTWLGALLAMAGMAVFFFGVLGDTTPDVPAPTGFPSMRAEPATPGGPDLRLGFGLFFVGLVLTGIGALGHATARRR